MSLHELDLEVQAIKITSYRIGGAFLTEVESRDSGLILARGIAATKEDSRLAAFEKAAQRLSRHRSVDLMVGG